MSGVEDRAYWVGVAERLATPVLEAFAARELKKRMPIGTVPPGDRADYTHLEAISRTLMGIAPWLENGPTEGEEGQRRSRLAALAREAMDAATDPYSPDFVNFARGQQPIVDTAFLSEAILRAPVELWGKLPAKVKRNTALGLMATRDRSPHFNNWLLFAAMTEVALKRLGEYWDPMRVDYAIRQHDQWYKGDGHYGDGPAFHWDYYNSFVIQPMLVEVLTLCGDKRWQSFEEKVLVRARRYAEVQERLINSDGTFPPIGRSLAYRCGAFHHLAFMALRRDLPEKVTPEQVRGALTAVIRRTIEAQGTFDDQGWLRIGLSGHQQGLGEPYISTGSCYLCSAALLPLGLPASDPFWSGPETPWTAKKIWSGEDAPADKAIYV